MHEELNHLGLIDEEDIASDEAAFSLSALDHFGTDLAAYQSLLDMMETRLKVVGGDAVTPAARAGALAEVLAGEFGFGTAGNARPAARFRAIGLCRMIHVAELLDI